jgi:hypothetical protein
VFGRGLPHRKNGAGDCETALVFQVKVAHF